MPKIFTYAQSRVQISPGCWVDKIAAVNCDFVVRIEKWEGDTVICLSDGSHAMSVETVEELIKRFNEFNS